MYYGIHNFDNFMNSFLVVFQLVTTENWSNYMFNLIDIDNSFFAALYSISIVVIGSFFLMNLILAVIIQAFITITRKELEIDIQQLDDEDNHKLNNLISESATAHIIDYIILEEGASENGCEPKAEVKKEVPAGRSHDAPLFMRSKT